MRHVQSLISLLAACVWLVLTAPAHAEVELHIILGTGSDTPQLYVVDGNTLIATYPIATPRHTPRCLYSGPVTGIVTFIDPHAAWIPTEATKRAAAQKGQPLSSYYAPGHPKNALGGRKVGVRWESCIPSTVRIHGTIRPDQIGHRVSRGCIRMHNADWDTLATRVLPGTRVTIQIYPPPHLMARD